MKKLLALVILPLLVAGSLSPVFTPSASAVTAADWKAGRIIDDSKFTGLDMSVADIQNFLNSKVPTCDTWGTQPASEYGRSDITHAQYAASRGWPGPPYVCLKNYHEVPKTAPGPGVPANSYGNGGNPPAGSISAAQMIYNAAQTYRISPKVLLVKLDTESAGPLTRDKWPLPTQYTYAMGAHCPDSGPSGAANCDPNYAGFSIQIAEAAELLRWYLDSMTQSWWQYKKPFQNNNVLWQNARGSFYNPSGTLQPQGCGYNTTYIETMGTAALYTYTPYQPNQAALNNMYTTGDACSAYGNRNFWRVYNDWFGRTTGTNLVRTPTNQTVYLLSNNQRFAIASGDILYAYGLERTEITTVSDDYLASVPDGGMLNTIFTTPGDGTVYLADGGKKYGIISGEYCVMWGLPCGNTTYQKEVGTEIANMMPAQAPLQQIMKFSNKYYLMQAGKKLPFLSEKALVDRGHSTTNTTTVINWTNAIRGYGFSLPENNTFVKFGSSSAIYLFSNNAFVSIPNYETFTSWFGPNGVSHLDTVSAYNTTPPTTTGSISNVVNDNGTISLVGYTQRFVLPGASPTVTPLNLASYPGLASLLASKQLVAVNETKALAIPGGTIFALKENTLRPIPSMVDLRLSYTDTNIVNAPSALLSAYPMGKLYTIPGRLFKPNSSAMYLYGADKYLWALGSMEELGPATTWAPGAIETSFANVDSLGIKIYSALVSIGSTTYVVQPDGSVRPLPSSVVTSTTKTMPIDGALAGRLRVNSAAVRFIRFDNGTIFQVGSTTINPLSSLTTYKNLGGSGDNTVQLPLKALPTFTVGPTI